MKEKIIAEIERLKNEDYGDGYHDDDVATCALNEVLSFIKSMRPQQPKGLDEVAKEIASDIAPTHPDIGWDECFEKIEDGIKAGAKWMAEQGVSFEYEVEDKTMELGYGKLVGLNPIINLPDSFDNGDKVIVQVRKKED